eukprot:TRINITY_DN8252_c0_g1_i1.p1 TRINITY_DN8252_c0_g1~~TRINITY_DN8252_c0_g1_i1.p1  ORF type:complete len:489 (+),score=55.17 TRINITY_DN8252_c0_g1_i1:53-1519(+)
MDYMETPASPTIIKFTHHETEPSTSHGDTGFGDKSISFTGGLCLVFNNITGPGMIALAIIYAGGGALPSTLLFALVALVSSTACLFLVEAMTFLPGNERFQSRVEFMYLTSKLLPRKWSLLVMVGFFCSLTISNLSSIVESSQTVDNTLIAIFRHTCALRIWPFPPGFECVGRDPNASIEDSPFGDDMVISLGFLLVLVLCIPLGYWNIDDNIIVQISATTLLVGFIFTSWVVEFFQVISRDGYNPDNAPAVGSSAWQQIGPIVFNYAFVVTIPSWVNEKKEAVSVHRTLGLAMPAALLAFVGVGWLAALAFPVPTNTDKAPDLLAVLTDPHVSVTARVGSYLFPWAALVSGIPIFSIIIRYNLLELQVCSKRVANLLAVVCPWVLALLISRSDLVNVAVSIGGLYTTIPLNFILPCVLYLIGVRNRPGGPVGDAEAEALLLQNAPSGFVPFRALPHWLLPHGPKVAWLIIAISVVGQILAIVFNYVN